MAKRFCLRHFILIFSSFFLIPFSQHAYAAAYQLFEQDGASVGNYHAGRAAIAEDASTAYYNPAGLVRIHNQQLVIGGDPVLTNIRYRGTVAVNTLFDPSPQPVTAQGGGFNFIPFGHYAAPLSFGLVFGLSVVVPYGLQTNYGDDTILRYAGTLTEVKVVDISPSLAIPLGDKLSFGFGIDAQHMEGNFNQMATALAQTFDTLSKNSGNNTAYGGHVGLLYQFNEHTRVGISYFSQVVHHLKGSSKFIGPLANSSTGTRDTVQLSNDLNATTTLPPTTTLSVFHTINPTWDVMSSITYTQWSVFKQLILNNVAGVQGFMETNSLQVIINQGYRNSWNYAVGANYHLNEKAMIRTGFGYDETPSNDRFRNIQLPDSDRVAVALGGHYQATEHLAFDLGWTHLFILNTRINNLSQTVGDEIVTTNGSVTSSADVYGLQMKWDIV